MRSIRIFFEKKNMAKYISHLDLMRCFSRAVKRARLNIWYTEGYNPHAFMTFSLPLSLGTESFCESVDIRMLDETPLDEIKDRLNETLPPDIRITKVAEPVHKADEIAFAEFEIRLNTDNPEKVKASVEEKISADEIIVEKKAKQGRKKVLKPVDIKGNIHTYELETGEQYVLLKIIISAGTKTNINPSLLIDAVTAEVKDDIESVDIKKNKMLLEDLTQFE